jgi:hypothetical protein
VLAHQELGVHLNAHLQYTSAPKIYNQKMLDGPPQGVNPPFAHSPLEDGYPLFDRPLTRSACLTILNKIL